MSLLAVNVINIFAVEVVVERKLKNKRIEFSVRSAELAAQKESVRAYRDLTKKYVTECNYYKDIFSRKDSASKHFIEPCVFAEEYERTLNSLEPQYKTLKKRVHLLQSQMNELEKQVADEAQYEINEIGYQ